MNNRKWLVGLALAASLAVTALLVLGPGNGSAETEDAISATPESLAIPVETMPVTRGVAAGHLTGSATVEAEQLADVITKAAGLLTEVLAREGEYVQKGRVLARIDDAEKTLGREQAQLRLDKATAEFNRATLSFEQELISKFDYDKAIFDKDLAASELKTAALELEHTTIRAPFSGRVTAKEVVVGRNVQSGDTLFTLADFSSLVAKLYLPEKDVLDLKPGQPVRLVLEARLERAVAPMIEANGQNGKSQVPDYVPGMIRDISPVVDPKTGTVKVTLSVTANTGIRPGAFVRTFIETARRENALLVPKVALIREENEDFVFIVENDRAKKRQVQTGFVTGPDVEVVEGLNVSDRVIVAGHTTLNDDDSVTVLSNSQKP